MKNEIIYNKLVRDRIPEIIENSGKKFSSHIAGDDEYKHELLEKVYEELEEFKENPCEEEMADILEVLEALIKVYNFGDEKLLEIKEGKTTERGAFDKRIVLERVWEEELKIKEEKWKKL